MLELEEARERILSIVRPLPEQSVPLRQAHGKFLSRTVIAPLDLPPFDNSAMDGYAVRSEDLRPSTAERPVPLDLIGQAAAGEVFKGQLGRGQCVRIFTGSPLPAGADAVIMQEDTRVNPAAPGVPHMCAPVKPWENVRFRGEDVKQGSTLLEAGERLTAASIALLAAMGCPDATVGSAPRVGLVATGSELREAGASLGPGQIYESNRSALAVLATNAGAQTTIYPLVVDESRATQSALSRAFDECDAVVTSGGVSVGEMDFVRAAFERLGGQLMFWKIAMRPGKPFAFGTCNGKLLFGLPGNPVSAFVTFVMLVRPALLRLQGAAEVLLPCRQGIVAETLSNLGNRRHFVRVAVDRDGQVRQSGTQSSHLLQSLARSNGLVDVPPKTSFQQGQPVPVMIWD